MMGRKLVITGAARGIGERVARLAAARGARVALIGLEPDRLRSLAEDLGALALWQEADVRDGTALRSAIGRCAEAMGGIDVVVANAGIAAYGTVQQADEASVERVVDTTEWGIGGGAPRCDGRACASLVDRHRPRPGRRSGHSLIPGIA